MPNLHGALFVRLLDTPAEDKAGALRNAVSDHRSGEQNALLFEQPAAAFQRMPTSAWIYDLPPAVADFFAKGSPIPNWAFRAHRGLGAANADHVFRLWWEVRDSDRGFTAKWTRMNNGSPYSPFYHPILHVVLSDRGTWRTLTAYPNTAVSSKEKYGQAGVGYGKRTNFMYGYPLPAETVFSVEGQALFPHRVDSLGLTLALANSRVYASLVNRFTAQHKYHGYLNALWMTPFRAPDVSEEAIAIAQELATIDDLNETSPRFVRPLAGSPPSIEATELLVSHTLSDVRDRRRSLDIRIEAQLGVTAIEDGPSYDVDYIDVLFGTRGNPQSGSWAANLFQWCLGCAVGRWSHEALLRPDAQSPGLFDALPSVPPGSAATDDAPEKGTDILVDDEGHPGDIVAAIRQVLHQCFGDRAGAIEEHGLTELRSSTSSPGDLRDWLRTSKATALGKAFFDFHIARYSKGRRKAPIYWRLAATPNAPYAVWLYYPRLTPDTLWRVLGDYVTPRRVLAERQLTEAKAARDAAGAGPARRRAEQAVADAGALLESVQALEGELRRVAERGYAPDLDDGVVISAAPLHRVIPWKEPAAVWKKLEAGDYDWAKLAMALWPERVCAKCETDRSLAIAHGLA